MQQVPPRFFKKNIAKNSLIKSWINYIIFLHMFSFIIIIIIIIISWRNSIGRTFFARDISPSQKWWQTLWGREISCSQWEGPSMLSRCLVFFAFKFGGGRGRVFFHFSSVATMFPLSSQWVLIRFPICSQCVSQHVLHSTSLLSHMLWQLLSSFHLYRWAKGEEL